MAKKRESEALDLWLEGVETGENPFTVPDTPGQAPRLLPSAPRGSVKIPEMPAPPAFVGELASSAVANSPLLAGSPAAFAGGVALDVGLNRIFPPTASELRAQAAGGLGEMAVNAIPALRKAKMGTKILARMFGQTAAVGAEQALEAATGNQSGGGAFMNTMLIGAMPAAAQEGLAKVGRALTGKTDANVVEAFDGVVESLDEFGVAFKNEGGAARTMNEIVSFLPFASDNVVARDKRVFAAMFKKFRELKLSPDVSVAESTGRPGERTLESITKNARAAFLDNGNVDIKTGELADIFPGKGESFAVRTDFSGPFKGKALKITDDDMKAIAVLAHTDPGQLAARLKKDASLINVVDSLDRVLPTADAQRVQNAFINEHILSPAIEQSKRGVDVDTVLGAGTARDGVGQLLEVRPTIMKAALEGKSSVSDEKLRAVMRLGGRTTEQADTAISALKAVANAGVEGGAGQQGGKSGARFLGYASNKFAFGTLALGGAGAASIDFGEKGSLVDRVENTVENVALGSAFVVGIGTAISLALNHPKAAQALTKIGTEGDPAITAFFRAIADTPFQFQPNPDQPGQMMLVEPNNEQIKEEQRSLQPGQSLRDMLGL